MCIRDSRYQVGKHTSSRVHRLLYRAGGESRCLLCLCSEKTGSLSTACFSFCCKVVSHILAVPMQMGNKGVNTLELRSQGVEALGVLGVSGTVLVCATSREDAAAIKGLWTL
eukprot:12900058-Prorocentrum_lima.AAC.1